MTKQELIKKAYGKSYDGLKDYINENGFVDCVRNRKISLIPFFDVSEIDFDGHLSRPKSLKGLEKNNGWTKIEKESDLPTIGEYYTIASFDNLIVEREFPHPKFSLEFNKEWWLKYITHYQQIIKPEKPLY